MLVAPSVGVDSSFAMASVLVPRMANGRRVHVPDALEAEVHAMLVAPLAMRSRARHPFLKGCSGRV